jgi:hypothetical protein
MALVRLCSGSLLPVFRGSLASDDARCRTGNEANNLELADCNQDMVSFCHYNMPCITIQAGVCFMSRIATIGAATVEIWDDYLETRFTLKVPAAGNDDAASITRAAALGYESTWMMSRDHELLLQSLIAEQRGKHFSPVLFGVAYRSIGGDKERIVNPLSSWQEESLVLSVQRYMRLGVVDMLLEQSGLDLEALKTRLQEITGG